MASNHITERAETGRGAIRVTMKSYPTTLRRGACLAVALLVTLSACTSQTGNGGNAAATPAGRGAADIGPDAAGNNGVFGGINRPGSVTNSPGFGPTTDGTAVNAGVGPTGSGGAIGVGGYR